MTCACFRNAISRQRPGTGTFRTKTPLQKLEITKTTNRHVWLTERE